MPSFEISAYLEISAYIIQSCRSLPTGKSLCEAWPETRTDDPRWM